MSGYYGVQGGSGGGSTTFNQYATFGEFNVTNYATGGHTLDLSSTYSSLNSVRLIPKTIGTLPASEMRVTLNSPGAGKANVSLFALSYDKTTAIGNVQNQPSGVTVQAASGAISATEFQTTVSDTFTRADSATSLGSADTGQAWTAQSGTWGISSNRPYIAVRSGGADVATLVGLNSGIISVDIATTAVADATNRGLVFRLADSSNFLEVALVDVAGTDRVVRIGKRVAGVFTQLAVSSAAQWTVGATITLRAEVTGNRITGFINGVSAVGYYLTTAENAAFTGTNCGFYVGTAANDDALGRFDNFLIQTAHYHSADHDHGSFTSGANVNSGAGVLSQTLGSSIGTHTHTLDIPNFTMSTSIDQASHTHADNSIYAHSHTESRTTAQTVTSTQIPNTTALNTTWYYMAVGVKL